MERYTFTLEVEVIDAAALYRAAKTRWIEDQHELLGTSLSDIALCDEIELEGVPGLTPHDQTGPA